MGRYGPRQINLVVLNRGGGRCMGNVRLARRAGNGRDGQDEAKVPTTDRVGGLARLSGASMAAAFAVRGVAG